MYSAQINNRVRCGCLAGNEWTSLEGWRSGNYTYSPCMIATDNTLCVGGTNVNDTIFYVFAFNQQAGTNFGPTTVDMGAPAHSIYTTDIAVSEWSVHRASCRRG